MKISKKCKPVRIEWGMFGWLVRMPNGSAARTKDNRFPKYFKSALDCQKWFDKQVKIGVMYAGDERGNPERWVVC